MSEEMTLEQFEAAYAQGEDMNKSYTDVPAVQRTIMFLIAAVHSQIEVLSDPPEGVNPLFQILRTIGPEKAPELWQKLLDEDFKVKLPLLILAVLFGKVKKS